MPKQRCQRCGTPRRDDLQVCLRCETPFDGELDLAIPRPAAPSTTQSHGTVMLGLLSGFVVLAALLWLSVRNIGPFEARLVETTGTGTAKKIVVEVTNKGSRPGRGNCQLGLKAGANPLPLKTFQSDRISGGESVRQVVDVETDAAAVPTSVRCS
jgi:hypothetical protein